MQLVPRDSFTSLFDGMFPTFKLDLPEFNGFFSPSVDIEEQDDSYVITADLPGVKKEDVSVTLEDGILTLSAERSEKTEKKKKGKIIRQERRSGSYSRSFTVGHDLKEADIQASFKDGVLTLKLPRPRQAASGSRRIPIS